MTGPVALRSGQIVASMKTSSFRQLMYESALHALEHGALVERVTGVRAFHEASQQSWESFGTGARIKLMRSQIVEHRASAKKARDLAVKSSHETTLEGFLADADAHEDRADALERQIVAMTAEAENPPALGSFESDFSIIAQALASFVVLPETVDAEVALALERVVGDLTVTDIGDAETEFEWWLRIPVGDGVVRFGPLRFALAHHRSFATRAPSVISRFSVAAGLEDDLEGFTWEDYTEVLRADLADRGVPDRQATVLQSCSIPEVIDVISARLLSRPMPAELDPAYIDLICRTYIDAPVGWVKIYAPENRHRQLAVDLVAGVGGAALWGQVRSRAKPYLPNSGLLALTKLTRPTPGSRKQVNTMQSVLVAETGNRRLMETSVLRLVECMHCGHGVDFTLRVPELVADMLLCRNCWRMPRIADSPRFPESYGQLFKRAVDELPVIFEPAED